MNEDDKILVRTVIWKSSDGKYYYGYKIDNRITGVREATQEEIDSCTNIPEEVPPAPERGFLTGNPIILPDDEFQAVAKMLGVVPKPYSIPLFKKEDFSEPIKIDAEIGKFRWSLPYTDKTEEK